MNKKKIATGFAILAAGLYAINVPLSKLLLHHCSPTMMAAFLYLGAAKTSAFYSVAPFLGVMFSMALQHNHEHGHIHTHKHRHGDMVHSHRHSHTHSHFHSHGTDIETHNHKHVFDVHVHIHP